MFLIVPRYAAHAFALSLLTLGGCATVHHDGSPPVGANTVCPRDCPPCAFPPPAPPVGVDALARWREFFPDFLQAYQPVSESLPEFEAADAPEPAPDPVAWSKVVVLLEQFRLGPGECLVFSPCHGPETPFPDHYPLRHLALARTIEVRRLIARGDHDRALDLTRQNLAQARATLRGQTGLIALIHATGVWQAALDAAHALARSPAFPAHQADDLRRALEADTGLLAEGVSRAFRGEYTHVYSVVVARLPQTSDLDHLLEAIGSLGMAPPEPEPLASFSRIRSSRPLLNPDATLAEFRRDMLPYLAALNHVARLPRGLYADTTARRLTQIQAEIPTLLAYAHGNEDWTPALERRLRTELAKVDNPVGKLLFTYLVSAWEPMLASALRREAQRGAVAGLLAWRVHGRPAPWSELVSGGRLADAPADPFSNGDLLWSEESGSARIWSVFIDGENQGGVGTPGNSGQPPDLVWPW